MSGISGCRRFVFLVVLLVSTAAFGQTVDLRVTSISDSIDPITLGTGDVTYTANVSNNGSSTATNAALTITLPASGTFVSASASNSGTCGAPSGGVLTCNWAGNLLGFNGRTATIVVTPTVGGVMTISGSIAADQPDSNTSNDSASTTTTVNASIDLRVSGVFDSIDPITLGTGDVTYTVNIINDSNSKATNPELDITLPAGATFVSHSASNGGTCSGPVGVVVTCNWAGDLLSFNGRSATVTVTPTAGGTMTLSATVSGDQPEADGSDNTSSTTTLVNASIDLRVSSVFDSIDPITLGTGDVTYTVNIINDSTSKATNAEVDITLPVGATFVSSSASSGGTCSGPVSGIVTCNWAGDLLAFNGRSATVTVTPTAGGTMTLSATVSGDQPEADGSDNTSSTTTLVNASIDLRVSSVFDSIDPITLGTGNVTYSVNIINDSTSKATNAKVDITLPAGATFVSHSASNSGTCSGPVSDVVTCNWAGDLLAFNGRTATVTVTPTAGGTMTVSATVSGDQPEADGSDNTSSTTTLVNASIDLRVSSVSDSIDPITLGTGNVTYTVNIINDSTSKATNAKVDITLPAGTTFVSHGASNSGTCSGPVSDVVTCNWAGDLLAFNGRTATVTVTPTAGGTMTTSATVSGDQPEADGSDNTSSATTLVNASIDLRVSSVSDSIDPITLGTGNVTYTVNIINDSTSKATNPKVDITLPAGATFVSHTASNSGTCSGPVSGVVTCNWAGDLLAFNGRTATVTVTPTAGGTMTTSATVSGDQPEADGSDNTSSATTLVNASIDLRVSSVSDSIDPVTLGTGNVTYTVNIINDSTSKATNAKVDITIPAGTTFVSHTASNSGTCSGPVSDVVTCNWAGDLLAFNGRTATVTITPAAGGTMTASATVGGDQPEADPSDNTLTTTTTVNASIDLQLTVSDSPDPRVLGAGNVTYTVNITNSSTSKATNAFLTFTLPAPVTLVSATATSGGVCSGPSGGVVTCNWAGDLLAFNGRTATIIVTPTNAGQLSASATVAGDQPDPNNVNNSETETTNINPSTPPTIAGFSPASGPIGTTVTISGSNFFSSTFVKFNGVNSTFTIVNNSSITATVPAGATTGLIAITNFSGTTSSASNFTVTPAPDLSITKTALSSTVPTSSPINYTLAVSNVGAGAANDVTVTDTLPAGVTLTSVSGSGWTCGGNPVITCTMGALAPGAAPNITIDVTAPATGTTVTNTATVSTSTPDASASNDSSSVAVGVVGCPTTPPITAPATVCANSTGHVATTPIVPGGTYAWTITNGIITSTTTSDTITFDASATDPVTLGVTVFVGACPSVSNSVAVNVSTPTATITPSGPTTFCTGGSVTLTANAGASYLWSNAETTQSIVVSGTGTFDVTVTDAAGCSATSAPINVTGLAPLIPTITPGGPTTFCDGGSVTLTASAGVSYLWSNGATTQSINVTSSDTFTVTVNDGTCNSTSAPTTVTVNPAPVVSITHSGPLTFCTGDNVILDAGAGFNSYLWSNGATTQAIGATASETFTVTVTDGNTCSATSAPITVTVNPNPIVTVSGPASACDSATLDAGPGFASYLWSNGATTQTANVTSTGSYTVTVTDGNGCQATSAPKNVTINSLPTPVITGPATACDNANLDAGPGFASYLWSNGATTQSINVTTGGTYSVTVTDANGCSGTDSHIIAINATPTGNITPSGPTTFCDGGSVTLTSTAAASYLWSNGATTQSIVVTTPGTFTVTMTNGSCTGVSPPVTINVASLPTPIITGPANACDNANLDVGPGWASYLWSNGATTQIANVTASGTYTVTVTDGSGCSGTDSHTITIETTPATTITPSGPTTFCTGGSVTLSASPAAFYNWSNGATTQSINVTASGTFTVVTSNGTCNATSAPVTVSVTTGLTPNIIAEEVGCGEYLLDAGPGYASYLWSTGATTQTINADMGLPYSVTVTDGNGCTGSDSITIPIPPAPSPLPPAITPHGPTTFCEGGSVKLSASPGDSYLWSNGATTPFIMVTASGTFTVVIHNGFCQQTAGPVTVNVLPKPDAAIAAPATAPANSGGNIASVAAFGAATYDWSIVNGTIVSGQGTNSIVFQAGSAGTTTLGVIVSANGCTSAENAGVVIGEASTEPCASRGIATPIAPANNADVHTSTVEFRWQPVTGNSGYRVLASVGGAPPSVLGTTTSETSLIAHVESGVIDWSVETLFDGCASTASPVFRFTIPAAQNCGTAVPELIAPANGSTTSDGNVTFAWTSVADALSYEVWLGLDSGTPTLIGATTSTSFTHAVTPGTLQWFVRAIIDRCPSRDSVTRTFTFVEPVACETNQRPIPIEPLPDARLTSPAEFFWSVVPGATSYQLFISTGNSTPLLVGSTNAGYMDGIALSNGAHRWFVRAHFPGNCTPLDSAEQQIVIVPPPAACAPLDAPIISAPGQISSGVELRIQWSSVPGATAYQLHLAGQSDFAGAEIIEIDGTQHSIVRVNHGNAPIAVYARVRAVDGRCHPTPSLSPFGPSSVLFILPPNTDEAGVPLTSDAAATFAVAIEPEFAGQTFTATVKEPWLSVTPASGVVPAGGMSLTVIADTSVLGVGAHLGTVFITLDSPSSANGIRTNATTFKLPTMSISKVTPVTPSPKSSPPPDALIIPAVAHANGINSHFQSDVRVSNSSAQLLQYQVTFTPSGPAGIATGRQTTFAIEPGRTIALDDVLRSWFGTGGESVTGSLEVRPLTQTTTSTSSAVSSGLANLVTFASSRTFNVTSNGTFGQHIPAIPFANFIGGGASVLSLQQIAQSDRHRTNLGIVEGSGNAASLLVKVFGNDGQKLTEFPVNLAGGEHTQLNAFLTAHGIGTLADGRVEISVTGGDGKITAYASVLDNDTNDPLLVTPVTLSETGATKWVVPGVADLNNGIANWQTDMRLFNAGTTDVEAELTFHSLNGGPPQTATVTIPAGQVRQFDKALSSVFGKANDGGAVHIATSTASRLVATARTYNQTTNGTYGQFISGVTPNEATGVGSRPLQILQVEESSRFRSNIGLAEVTGKPVTLEVSVVPPDAKITVVTEVQLQANEFRQLNSLLRSVGLADTYNARVSVRAIDGQGRVTAYASVIDMLTNDPTYVPAQ
ncbi:MAG: hypothetical protein M3P06_12275 [Acidobacteriota bacterium]|nr:hypothetical protein [Acidobacteriota bacterium]